jgi:hypothetical protein
MAIQSLVVYSAFVGCTDRYGLPLTGGADAVASYNRGVGRLLRLEEGALPAVAASIAFDPTFALGHAGLALLGHELCAPVDIDARLRDAALHARRGTERERSHVHAVTRHIAGDSRPLVAHLQQFPADALLLDVAVPTIAFAGVTRVPQDAWEIVERCAPAYGEDWWFSGLLAFIRQEQGRFDEAMQLSCLSLDAEPGAGHSAHARAHAHYETGDHAGGLTWIDGWITGAGAHVESLSHFSWHAALHELSMGDLDAVRRRYDVQLRPRPHMGCRSLVDSGSLLWRWALTPGCQAVPEVEELLGAVETDLLRAPQTPFMAMHAAVVLCMAEDRDGLASLAASCAARAGTRRGRGAPGARAPPAGGRRRVGMRRRPGPAHAAAVARRRQRRPAGGRRGDPDLRLGPGREVHRGARAHRPAPGPSSMPARRVVPGIGRDSGRDSGRGAGSADRELTALHGDLLLRQRLHGPGGRAVRPLRVGTVLDREVTHVARADDLVALDLADGAALVGAHRGVRLEVALGRLHDDDLLLLEDRAAPDRDVRLGDRRTSRAAGAGATGATLVLRAPGTTGALGVARAAGAPGVVTTSARGEQRQGRAADGRPAQHRPSCDLRASIGVRDISGGPGHGSSRASAKG